MHDRRFILYTFVILALGVVGGYAANEYSSLIFRSAQKAEQRMIGSHGTRLTNPLLECKEQPERFYRQNLVELEEKVQSMVRSARQDGNVTFGSVYYRDLNNGLWFGVNESEEFFPASLLKLPLVMSFYWKQEDDRTLFEKEVMYTPDPNAITERQPFGPEKNVVAGQKYTIADLIRLTLQESSNEAALMLAGIAGDEQIFSVYRDLGLSVPSLNKDYKIDAHTYASFFRIMYNATYIDRSASEEVLTILTEASFKRGLVAGLPEDIVVAHKFGSRKTEDGESQLHDCGIIYAPGRPYILCVMTQGNNFMELAEFIKSISQEVYKEVISQK